MTNNCSRHSTLGPHLDGADAAEASAPTRKRLNRRGPAPLALEQRFMFDGAAVDAAMDAAKPVGEPLLQFAAPENALPAAIVTARADAEKLVTDFLSQPDARSKLFAIFNGGQSAPSDQWNAAVDKLLANLQSGVDAAGVELRSNTEMQGAKGAFASAGVNGQQTIYLNANWLAGNPGAGIAPADSVSVKAVLVEELGHSLDAFLNGAADTTGDEGEHFADVLLNGKNADGTYYAGAQDDHGTLTFDDHSVNVEFASFSFVNAYEMVYDIDNTNSISPGDTWAAKEQNSHYFKIDSPLGQVSVTDGTGNQSFSGNDVSAVAVTMSGQTYYGWISRPIKSNGVVRGFYFWTDASFTNLALAQADGNTDGDGNVLDNRGFLLVVDQTWFNSAATSNRTVNNAKDGNLGSITLGNVGSSSDRVDAAVNSLIVPNSPASPANDTLTLAEDSGAMAKDAAHGLLSNDTDADNDILSVTQFTVNGATTVVTTSGTYSISGVGSITINKDGSYTFTPVANYNGSAPPITYTVSDGKGGTSTAVLSITVTAVNDAPVSTNDSITTAVNTPKVLGLDDFGTYADPDNNPLVQIQITSLPLNGTLQYWNGTAWATGSVNQTFTTTQILQGQVRYSPGNEESGSNYATLQFKTHDGQAYSASAYTLTVNVTGNLAPIARADSNSVVEAGNNVAAAPATGNVINGGTADSDPDNDTLHISGITAYGSTQTVSAGTSSANGRSITGQYGTLTIGADGSYSYVLNNSLAAIDAMGSGDSKTETFSYTLSDGHGGTATTTLTLIINGSNDKPAAADDFSTFVEGTNASAGNYGTVTGNALTNDTDVDNTHSDLKVNLTDGTSPPNSADITLSASSPISAVSLAVTQVSGSWTAIVPTSGQVPVWLDSTGTNLARDRAGNTLTVYRSGSGGSATLVFSDNVALYNYQNTDLFIKDPGNSNIATVKIVINSASTSSSTTISTTSDVSGIKAGYTVSGTGIPTGVTVSSVNAASKTITLSQAVNIANTSLTFHDPNALSITSTQAYFAGNYGYLILNENGSYTYTLTTDLTASQVINETFTYHAKDPAGAQSAATINIRVTGVDAPKSVNDTLAVYEDSGSHKTFNGSAGNDASDSLSANDLNGTSVTLGNVTAFKVGGDNTTYNAGSTATIAGVGTLTINADGTVVFDPVDDYTGSVPTVTYTRTGSDASSHTAYLTISIDAVDDASSLAADSNTVNEESAVSGNVLGNDSDNDSTLSVASFGFSSNGSTVSYAVGSTSREMRDGSNALIGAIVINTDGTYTFTPTANWNGTVPQVTYTTNTGFSSTLSITVAPMNDRPVLDLNASGAGTGFSTAYTNAGTAVSIGDTDVLVTDVDNANIQNAVIVLANPYAGDSLNIGTLPDGISATTSTAGGVITVTLSGAKSLSDYQDAVRAVTFSSTGNSTATRVVSIVINDGSLESNTAYTAITVNPDNRAVTVLGTEVNEASPYVMFNVSGAQDQWVNLSLGETGRGSSHAAMGTDFLPNLQYYNGSAWVDYSGGFVQITDASGKLLVRAAVLQDTAHEGAETLKLTVSNAASIANITTDGSDALADGTARIRDEGQGTIYLASNNSFSADVAGTGFPSHLDDDRAISLNNVVVNEGSTYAILTIEGSAGIEMSLAWQNGAGMGQASPTADAANPRSDGTDDFGPSLEYWNGSAWTNYTGNVTMSGSRLYVRTAIVNDTAYEGMESFSLQVTKVSSGASVYGMVSIADDGTGVKYMNDDDPAQSGLDSVTTARDDDRTISVTGNKIVNENSAYASFTVAGNVGQVIELALGNTAVTTDSDATATGFIVEYSLDNGGTWNDYSWNGTTGNRPEIPANGAGQTGTVLVRVNIASERDNNYEGPETFTLTASYATNTSISATATDTIIDDSTGMADSDGKGNDAGGSKDDDRSGTLPVANADTASATEDSATAVTGNVIASSDTGTGIKVTQVQKGSALDGTAATVNTGTTAADGRSIAGNYGTLTIGADGSYSYSLDSSKSAVQALQQGGSTLADTFVYQITDQAGQTATATLVVTIDGINDAPVVNSVPANQTATIGIAFSYQVPVFSDADTGDTITYSASGLPSGFTFDAATRTITGTPSATNAAQTVTIRGTDSKGAYVETTFTLTTVNPGAPVANADTASATEDSATAVTGNVIASSDTGTGIKVTQVQKGSALDGTAATVNTGTTAADGRSIAGNYGTLTIGADGSYSYSLDSSKSAVQALQQGGSTLADTFVYQITDQAGQTATATLVVTVSGVNDTPTANNTSFTTPEDTTASGSLPGANDPDGDAVTYAVTSAPDHGSVSISAGGNYMYTPAADYHGSDSFSYSVSDGRGGSNTYSVSVTVTPVNDAPVGSDGAATTSKNTSVSGSLPTATDADGDALTYALAGGPAHGSVSVSANGSYTYTPAAKYFGSDSFSYTVSDGKGGTSSYTINVTVTGRNEAPTAADTSVSLKEDGTVSGSLPAATDKDGDTVTYAVAASAAHGSVSIGADGSYTYTPPSNYHGTDSFSYMVSDGLGGTNTYTVSVMVTPVNDAPVGTDASISTVKNTPVSGNLPGATDPDGDALTYALAGGPAHGSVSIGAGGSYSYTPVAKYHGGDSFSYTVSDGHGGTAAYTVSVIVGNTNVSPVGADTSVSTPQNTPASGTLPAATDADEDALTYALASSPANGSVTVGADGSYTYTPATNYHGTDSFNYTVSDGRGGSTTHSVSLTITVTPVTQPNPAVEVQQTTVLVTETMQPTTSATASPPSSTLTSTTDKPAVVAEAKPVDPPLIPTLHSSPFAKAAVDDVTGANGQGRVAVMETLTSSAPGATRIAVFKADEPALMLFHGVPDQNFDQGSQVRFQLPADAFVHTQQNAVVRVTAEKTEGGPLPGWLRFDASTGKFEGKPPANAPREVSIRITARDADGREASTIFRIKLVKEKDQRPAPAGRISLSEQIRSAVQRPAQQERLAKLERAARSHDAKSAV